MHAGYSKRQVRRGLKRLNPVFPSNISPELAEIWRLVPLDTPEAILFQSQMESFLKKLVPEINFQEKPIKFLILDNPEFDAFMAVTFNPPLIGFSKGLLQKVKYLEDLCGVLGHEFTHKRFAEVYGFKHHNTKLEELTADTWPLLLLIDAGLDPRQYVEFAKNTVFSERIETIIGIIDVHPTNVNRIRALEDGLAVLDQKRGGFSKLKPTLLPEEFSVNIGKAKHYSYVDLALQQKNFSNLTSENKINFLKELTLEITKLGWDLRRLIDLTKVFQTLKIKRSKLEEKIAQDQLADIILTIPVWKAKLSLLGD